MKIHKRTALAAGVAIATLALAACSGSSGGTTSTNGGGGGGGTSSPTSGSGSGTGGTIGGVSTTGTGNFASCSSTPDTCNSGTAKSGGTVTYVLEKTIPGWNVNTGNSGVFEVAEVEDGILPTVFNAGPDLKPFLNKDLMVSAEQKVSSSGAQTLIYKIKPNAVWSDGKPINFDDFKYFADVNNPATCPNCGPASTAGYTSIKSMSSSDNGKTVTIQMKQPFADWESMFGALLPAHIAAEHGGTSGAKNLAASFTWFDKNVPTFSGGSMMIKNYQKDTSITEAPNPKYYGQKSKVGSVIFRIITDQTQEVPALQNHEVDAIYPQPNADIVSGAKALQGVSTSLGQGLVWEHFDLNQKNPFLKDKSLREAIFTAVDTKTIIAHTVGQFDPNIQPLGNHIYLPGQAGYQDNLSSTGQGSGDVDKAKQILTSAGYTGVGSSLKTKDGKPVTLTCMYSQGNTIRQSECQIMQSALQSLGIKCTLRTTTDLHELSTGDFDIVVFAWQGTPFVIAGAQQIWELKGGGDYAHNNDPAEEKLINEAAVQTDPAKAVKLLNEADVKLTADAAVLPLYPKPSFLAASDNVVNIRDNATSVGPPYNVNQWGLKS